MNFENEVRRVAHTLWTEARYSGAVNVDGRERDGIFETEECIHLLEIGEASKRRWARVTAEAATAAKAQQPPAQGNRCEETAGESFTKGREEGCCQATAESRRSSACCSGGGVALPLGGRAARPGAWG